MKKLIFILIVGSLFGETNPTNSLDKMILIDGTVFEGEYISMNEGNIIFKPSGYLAGQSVDKSKVEIVKLSDGTIIYDRKTYKNADEKAFKEGYIGGALIAAGGVLLYTNIDKEISDYDSIEEWSDSIKLTSKLGYGLIIAGGFLVLVGI